MPHCPRGCVVQQGCQRLQLLRGWSSLVGQASKLGSLQLVRWNGLAVLHSPSPSLVPCIRLAAWWGSEARGQAHGPARLLAMLWELLLERSMGLAEPR